MASSTKYKRIKAICRKEFCQKIAASDSIDIIYIAGILRYSYLLRFNYGNIQQFLPLILRFFSKIPTRFILSPENPDSKIYSGFPPSISFKILPGIPLSILLSYNGTPPVIICRLPLKFFQELLPGYLQDFFQDFPVDFLRGVVEKYSRVFFKKFPEFP